MKKKLSKILELVPMREMYMDEGGEWKEKWNEIDQARTLKCIGYDDLLWTEEYF